MDLQIQQHIRNLKWISTKDLMCPIDLYLPDVPPLLMKAIKGLIIRIIKLLLKVDLLFQFLFDTAFQLYIHTFSSNPKNRRQSGNTG